MFTFISPNHIKSLKNLKLIFTTLHELNDQFINNIKVHKTHSETELSESEFEQALNKVYQSMEPHLKAMVSWEYYLKQALQNKRKIEPTLVAAERQIQTLPNVNYYSKVACLRLFPYLHQVHLWDLYGHAHQGIAIELDTTHEYFTAAKFEFGPQLFKAIKYDDLRPAVPSKYDLFPALLSQPEHCAYEQEWRLIRALNLSDKMPAEFKIPRGVIKHIYLGLRCETGLVEELAKLIKLDRQFRQVTLRQMAVSETHLRLQSLNLSQYI
ncbi:MAG: hypothetical protein ACI843_002617 [Psychrobacter glaciei]|jgi:hypothetical protein